MISSHLFLSFLSCLPCTIPQCCFVVWCSGFMTVKMWKTDRLFSLYWISGYCSVVDLVLTIYIRKNKFIYLDTVNFLNPSCYNYVKFTVFTSVYAGQFTALSNFPSRLLNMLVFLQVATGTWDCGILWPPWTQSPAKCVHMWLWKQTQPWEAATGENLPMYAQQKFSRQSMYTLW